MAFSAAGTNSSWVLRDAGQAQISVGAHHVTNRCRNDGQTGGKVFRRLRRADIAGRIIQRKGRTPIPSLRSSEADPDNLSCQANADCLFGREPGSIFTTGPNITNCQSGPLEARYQSVPVNALVDYSCIAKAGARNFGLIRGNAQIGARSRNERHRLRSEKDKHLYGDCFRFEQTDSSGKYQIGLRRNSATHFHKAGAALRGTATIRPCSRTR